MELRHWFGQIGSGEVLKLITREPGVQRGYEMGKTKSQPSSNSTSRGSKSVKYWKVLP